MINFPRLYSNGEKYWQVFSNSLCFSINVLIAWKIDIDRGLIRVRHSELAMPEINRWESGICALCYSERWVELSRRALSIIQIRISKI